MTIILVPESGAEEVQINQWNWKPTVALIRSLAIVDDEMAHRLVLNGTGGCINELQAQEIAAAVADKLGEMRPSDRMLMDLSIISSPKSKQLDDPTIYSATYEWLQTFQSFCESSGGFKAV